MVSTPEVFTNTGTRFPMNPTKSKYPSDRKSLCLFTNMLDVKKKTAFRLVGDDK